jgi:hypothetical protein
MKSLLWMIVMACATSGLYGAPDPALAHKGTGLTFPKRLGRYVYQGSREYKNNSVGIALAYINPGISRLAFYIYPIEKSAVGPRVVVGPKGHPMTYRGAKDGLLVMPASHVFVQHWLGYRRSILSANRNAKVIEDTRLLATGKPTHPLGLYTRIAHSPEKGGVYTTLFICRVGDFYVTSFHTSAKKDEAAAERAFREILAMLNWPKAKTATVQDVVGIRDVAAQRNIGFCYFYGYGGVARNLARAEAWLAKGAARNDGESMVALGQIYEESRRAPKALAIWEKAGKGGYGPGYYMLGKYHLRRKTYNRTKAKAYLTLGAKLGSKRAEGLLGQMKAQDKKYKKHGAAGG